MTVALACALLLAPGAASAEGSAAAAPAAGSAPLAAVQPVSDAPPTARPAADIPGTLISADDPRFLQVKAILQHVVPPTSRPATDASTGASEASAPARQDSEAKRGEGSSRSEVLPLDEHAVVRLLILASDASDRQQEAAALRAAMPPAVRCIVTGVRLSLDPADVEPTQRETDAIAALGRAAGLDVNEQGGLAVVLLARNDATAWVAMASGERARFAAACLAMAGLAVGMSPSLPAASMPASTAPASIDDSVTLTAIPSGTQGTLRKILTGTDKPVLLTFWADWCKPCLNEMPVLERLHAKYGNRIRFIGLANGRLQNPRLAKILTEKGVTFENHAFVEQSLYRGLFKADVQLPTLAVLDGSRRLVHVTRGAVTEPAALESLVSRLDALVPPSAVPGAPQGDLP